MPGTFPARRTPPACPPTCPDCGHRVQLPSFTAQGPDADGTSELLDSCLRTEEELASGETGWKAPPDAFQTHHTLSASSSCLRVSTPR